MIVALPAAAYLAYDFTDINRSVPPGSSCTLAEMAAEMPQPSHLAVVNNQGNEWLVWLGPTPRFIIRSGPPCYLFDRSGRLTEWCRETGEGWKHDEIAQAAYRQPTMTIEAASRWCESLD